MLSKFTAITFVNFAAGGIVGFLVDASSGANWTYPKNVVLELSLGSSTVVVPVQARDPEAKPAS